MAQTVKIHGVTYNDVAEVKLPLAADTSTLAVFPDTSDADAVAGNILTGKSGYVDGVKITGNMPNNGAVTGSITTKAGAYTVPAGYHSGGGSVAISATEQAKIIAGNIKAGITILGVAGSSNVVDTSAGDATAAQIMSGKKAYVDGALITGTKTDPSFALAAGVLTIS